jgi:hypothetical protein
MRQTSGLHPGDRWTAVFWITALAVAMLLLGSIAAAFYTQFKIDPWLQMGAREFFAATGVSGLLFTTRLAGTCWLPISPPRDLSPRRRWTLAALIPVDMLAMGFGGGRCHLVYLRLSWGVSMLASLLLEWAIASGRGASSALTTLPPAPVPPPPGAARRSCPWRGIAR